MRVSFKGEKLAENRIILHYMQRSKFQSIEESGKFRFAKPVELRHTDLNEFRYPKATEDALDDRDDLYNEMTRYASIPPKTRADRDYDWRSDARKHDELQFSISWHFGRQRRRIYVAALRARIV